MRNKLIILLLLLPFAFYSQDKNDRQENRRVAVNQIQQLKSSALLVRLYNKKNVIEALESKGMEKRANAVKNKQEKVNEEIISSFDKFSFCEVFFFYSDDSRHMLSREYSKVELFNKKGEKEVSLDGPNFFVADFGILKNEDTNSSDENGSNKTGRTKVKQYKGNNNGSNKRCMFLRDSSLEQLNRPFPFTVWFHPTPIQKLSYQEVVERMDIQLIEFHAMNK